MRIRIGMNPLIGGVIAGALALGAASAALAQPRGELVRPAGASGRARPDSVIFQEITEKLASPDAAVRKAAIDEIRQRMLTGGRGLQEMRATWIRTLTANKLHQELADLALEGILAHPYDTRGVEACLQARVKALIQLGKGPEALANAKSLFNVATMGNTSDAILAVAEAINAAAPDDVALYNKYREEQMAGAAAVVQPPPPSTQPAKPSTQPAPANFPRVVCTVLAGIKVDAKPYEDAARKITGEDAQSLMGKGNLLLLADRPKEARAVFERMYSLSGADLAESSEALARAMKAEDGTIARANSWVLSIRPRK